MIPVTQPTLPSYGEMESCLRAIVTSGQLVNGQWVERFELQAAQYLQVQHVVACSSGTTGLIAALATLSPGSTVVMPSYTYSATYQAALWNQLRVLLFDCDEHGNLDADLIREKLKRGEVQAIVAVHLHGNACDVLQLRCCGEALGVPVIYDAAHAFGSRYGNAPLAGWGDLEVFSCSPTKPLALGEGGLIATNNSQLATQVRLICQQGQLRGSLDATRMALNGRLSEINACIGCHALPHLNDWLRRRRMLAALYYRYLEDVPGITFQRITDRCLPSYKDFVIYVDERAYGMNRDTLMAKLEHEHQIQTKRYFYPPIHMMEMYRGDNLYLPVTEKLATSTLALPLYAHMPIEHLELVCHAIKSMAR